MIDWKAMKTAADMEPEWGLMKDPNFDRAKYENMVKSIAATPPDLVRSTRVAPFSEPAKSAPKIGLGSRSYPIRSVSKSVDPSLEKILPWHTDFIAPIAAGKAKRIDNGHGLGIPVFKSGIRPLLYGEGNEEREREETAEAMNNRWARLYQATHPAYRPVLDAYRKAGYIPPIMMGNWGYNFPESLDSTAKVSMIPGRGRSWAHPFSSRAFIGDGTATWRPTTAHELAHLASPTYFDQRGNPTVVKGVLGDDAGEEAWGEGRPGSYELNPGEMTRLILLQKAAAARLGLPRFRTFDEWREFNGEPLKENLSGRPVREDELSNPYDPSSVNSLFSGGKRDFLSAYENYSESLGGTLDMLEKTMRDTTKPLEERRRAFRQFQQIRAAIQDAIDMAAVGKEREGVLA